MNSESEPEPIYVYVNFEDTAPCSGTVYAWRYCSFPTSEDAPFQVFLAIYHNDIEGDTFELVNGSLHNLTVEENTSSLTCQDVPLDPSEQFAIQQGDMVAACWSENVNRVQLFAMKSNKRLMYWSSGLCFQENLSTSGANIIRRHTLLLSAHISK